jgi:hypothetical protein
VTSTKVAGKAATPSVEEFLADDRVVDACVRAWLGPVPLLTIGLRVVVASVQTDEGSRSSKARAVRTTLRVPQIGSAPKRPDAPKAARRNGGTGARGAASQRDTNGGFRSAVAKIRERGRWFGREGDEHVP